MFDPHDTDPVAVQADGSLALLDPEPTDAERALIRRVLEIEAAEVAEAEELADLPPESFPRQQARLSTLGRAAFASERVTRRSTAQALRDVRRLVTEVLGQDRLEHRVERSEAMEHAVHEVAAALGVSHRTAEIRVADSILLVDDLPRTLAVLELGYLPPSSALEIGRRLADASVPLREAVEVRVLDTLGRGSDLLLGSGSLDELRVTGDLEPHRAMTVSLAASRGRVRRLVSRALQDLGPLFFSDDSAGERDAGRSPKPPSAEPVADLEAWPSGRPGFSFLGAHLRDADTARILERIDHLARTSRRDPAEHRSLAELRAAWYRALLLGRHPGADPSSDPDGCNLPAGLGVAPVPVHLTVHVVGDRPAAAGGSLSVDSDRLGPVGSAVLSDLIEAATTTGGSVTVRRVQLPTCPGVHEDPGPYEPSDRLREAVIARDRTCRFPGCTVPGRSCDLDHTIPYDARGPTCHCNLACLCRTHHRLKTSGRWKLTNHGDGRLTWISPTGRTHNVEPDLP